MQHPLVPQQTSSKPVGASKLGTKELVVPIPTFFGVVLETLAVLLGVVAAPILALVVLSLSAYKTTTGWMRTTLQMW